MKIELYDPAYYSNIFGIEKEIRIFLDDISEYYNNKNYSECIEKYYICSVVAPKNVLENGLWPNEVNCDLKYHHCDAFNQIDYDTYVNASLEERKSLLVKNILVCMKLLEKKAKLDYLAFEKDMLDFCRKNNINIDTSDINDIVKSSKPKKPKRNIDELYWTIKTNQEKQEYDDKQNGYAIIDDYFTMIEMEDIKYLKLIPSIPLNEITYLNTKLDKKTECLIIEAHTIDSKEYVKDALEIGEGLDIFVRFYDKHKLDLSKWKCI